MGGKKNKPQAQPTPGPENAPHSVNVSFLQVFRVMQVLGFVSVFVTALVHILVLVNVNKPDSVADVAEVLSVVLFFITAIILLAGICEAKALERSFGFLLNWVGLGSALFYLAIVTLALLSSNAVRLDEPFDLIVEIVCWVLAAVGVLLFVLGMCGCKRIKDKDEAIMMSRSSQDPKVAKV